MFMRNKSRHHAGSVQGMRIERKAVLAASVFGKLGHRIRGDDFKLSGGRGGATIEAELGRSIKRTVCGISLSANLFLLSGASGRIYGAAF
jgi:hypothetical protein